MKNKLILKYPCVSHEVYSSDNLEELTPDFPKILCNQYWGTNKIVLTNQSKEKIIEIPISKGLGFEKKQNMCELI